MLLKGGRLFAEETTDVLWDGHALHLFAARKIPSTHTHGTGCTLSAAITALLAKGIPLHEAVARAKRFVTRAIETAPGIGGASGRSTTGRGWTLMADSRARVVRPAQNARRPLFASLSKGGWGDTPSPCAGREGEGQTTCH